MSEQPLRRKLERDPGDIGARIALAELLQGEGRGVEAVHLTVAGLALAAAGQARTDSLAAVAREQFRLGHIERANHLAGLAGCVLPQPGTLEDAQQGDALRRSGALAAAEAAYLACLAGHPGHAPALRGLAVVETRLGRPAEALAVARAGMALDPGRHGMADALAEAATAAGDLESAAEALTLMAAREPGDAKAARRAAEAWGRCGRLGEAALWLRRAGAADEAMVRHFPANIPADEAVREALCRVPLFAGADWKRLACAPLEGGNRNTLIRVDLGGRSLAVRLGKYPRPRWTCYWEERHNLRIAHGSHLAPAILYMDVADGTLVAPYLDGVLSSRRMMLPETLDRLGRLFARLHAGPDFLGTVDPLPALELRENRIAGQSFAGFDDLADLRRWMVELRALMAASAPGFAPCHNDVTPANLIDGPDGLVLVDWQTAGMADPDWEVGAVFARIPTAGILRRRFLAAVHGDADHPRAARVRVAEVLSRYVEMVEGLQMSLEEPEDTGWLAHAHRAFALVRGRQVDDDLGRALDILRR